jgi:hypothetical protein
VKAVLQQNNYRMIPILGSMVETEAEILILEYQAFAMYWKEEKT